MDACTCARVNVRGWPVRQSATEGDGATAAPVLAPVRTRAAAWSGLAGFGAAAAPDIASSAPDRAAGTEAVPAQAAAETVGLAAFEAVVDEAACRGEGRPPTRTGATAPARKAAQPSAKHVMHASGP